MAAQYRLDIAPPIAQRMGFAVVRGWPVCRRALIVRHVKQPAPASAPMTLAQRWPGAPRTRIRMGAAGASLDASATY